MQSATLLSAMQERSRRTRQVLPVLRKRLGLWRQGRTHAPVFQPVAPAKRIFVIMRGAGLRGFRGESRGRGLPPRWSPRGGASPAHILRDGNRCGSPADNHLQVLPWPHHRKTDRKSTRLNSSHVSISYAVFCLKKKTHMHVVYTIDKASNYV